MQITTEPRSWWRFSYLGLFRNIFLMWKLFIFGLLIQSHPPTFFQLWRPCYWSLVENWYTLLIKARMRHWPHNRTSRKDQMCVRACECVVPNQSTPRVRTLADYLVHSSAIDIRIKSAQKCSNTLHQCVASRVAVYPLVRCLSHLAVPSSHAYIFVLVTVNTQYFSKQRLHPLSVEAQHILETTSR